MMNVSLPLIIVANFMESDPLIIPKLVKQELDDATHYYEVELQGFGKLFREEVRKAGKKDCSISRGMVCRTRRC